MIERVLETARANASFLPPTPAVRSPLLSERFGLDVWLKLETESPVGSFKARGALRCLAVRAKEGHRTFVTASSGNHGMAVAFAGHRLDLPTHVFVPGSASRRKIELIRHFTSNLVLTDSDFDAAKVTAREFARQNGFYFIDDGAEIPIVEGTGTIALEFLKEVTPDAVIVPVGNGALIAGIGTVVKALSPGTRVIGVQPETAPTMYLSWKEKRAVEIESAASIADGLVSRVAVPMAVDMMNKVMDDMFLVSEQELADAVRVFVQAESRIAEPSSAASIAVLGRPELRARRVVAIITGRNIDVEKLREMLG